MGQIAAFILPVGIDHGQRGRQGFGPQMVVQNDHIRALRRGNRPVRQGSAIDTDDQGVIACQGRHGRVIGAVAFVDPVRDIERGRKANLAQPENQQCRGTASIHIIIRENRDPFASVHRLEKTRRGGFHIAQAARIGQQVA